MAQRQFRSDDTSSWRYGFGNGSDGALVISANTTYTVPTDGVAGISGSRNITLDSSMSFVNGDLVLIHQTGGTGAGNWELNRIGSGGGSLTPALVFPLTNSYLNSGTDQAQIIKLKQYSSVTINAGCTLSPPAWDGNIGGILAFLCNGALTIASTGKIDASLLGFRGGAGSGTGGGSPDAFLGEGYPGLGGQKSPGPNGNGGGSMHSQGATCNNGAGGGNGTAGTNGSLGTPSQGGLAVGNAGLTSMFLGGGGGGGNRDFGNPANPDGGNGGGIIFIAAGSITNSGSIISNGNAGVSATVNTGGGGGGGAGGSILLKTKVAVLGAAAITASGGAGGIGGSGHDGGAGAAGRIHLDYLSSKSGTTSPTLDFTQDSTLHSRFGAGAVAFL